MLKRNILFVLSLFTLQTFAQNITTPIIPAPVSVIKQEGYCSMNTPIHVVFKNNRYTEHELKTAQLLERFVNANLITSPTINVADTLRVEFNTVDKIDSLSPEGYQLKIRPHQIIVIGREAGLFYAVQTLIQLLGSVVNNQNVEIPCLEIKDFPRYSYRGMHLDVGRHLFPLPFLLQFIDIMAVYKFNNFHWHLTDDQGWRIEIKKYPNLTVKGAYRDQTLIGNYHERFPQFFDSIPYGGYYTQEEIKTVVSYAQQKYINVIPEIEMPGHSLAALAAYPHLACSPGEFKTAQKWGVFEDVFCAGKEETFTFLEDVLTEVIALFPSAYIHIGGDECPKVRWKQCSNCQKRMRVHHLKTEHELQTYFVKRIEKFLNAKGRRVIGWDELLEGGLAPNVTIMSWRGISGGVKAAHLQHDAIMTPMNFVYFDHLQGRSDQEPLTIGGFTPLEEVYQYDPTPGDLTSEQQKRIIGVQANVWTEYMETSAKVSYMTYPRMLALSEIAWTPLCNKNYQNFITNTLPYHLYQFDKQGINYRVPPPIGSKDTVMLGKDFVFELKPSVKEARIYYTVDGYSPDLTTNLYQQPIHVVVPEGQYRELKTLVVTPSGKRSVVTKTLLKNQTTLLPAVTVSSTLLSGLRYQYYKGNFNSVACLDTAIVVDTGMYTEIIKLKKFRSSAIRTFGLILNGYINIPDDGIYTFSTLSDDGSQCWIDKNLVVDNDGRHAVYEAFGAIALKKGLHEIKFKYFDGGGGSELRCFMQQQGKTKIEINPASLFH